MLKSRAGFTLAEVLVALTMTAVIGAAVTGAFVSQSRFFDHQERVGAARNISRAGINLLTSELRMVEVSTGVVAATNSSITLRVPYAMGLYCGIDASRTVVALLPVDSSTYASASYSGYASRGSATMYTPVPNFGMQPVAGNSAVCTGAGVNVLGRVVALPGATTPPVATPIFMFQTVTYTFSNSGVVPGRRGLFRFTPGMATPEELLAPFDTTAKFRFYVNDGATAQNAAPAVLTTITGLEITLDGLSERPSGDGTFQSVPLRTSVYFRNR